MYWYHGIDSYESYFNIMMFYYSYIFFLFKIIISNNLKICCNFKNNQE